MTNNEEERLLSANESRDHRTVKWAVADIFEGRNRLYITYHVMFSGWHFFTPMGCLCGSLLWLIDRSHNLLQTMGTGGVILGVTGMGMGLVGLTASVCLNPDPVNKPWNHAGIQKRVDGLSRNFLVRVVDLGAWIGMVGVVAVVIVYGGPTKLGLSSGMRGTLQSASLGAAAGTVAAITYNKATK